MNIGEENHISVGRLKDQDKQVSRIGLFSVLQEVIPETMRVLIYTGTREM
jgi:hypothetical protein